MKATRRHFLKVAGITSLGLLGGLSSVTNAQAQVAPKGARYEKNMSGINAKRFAMVIDTRAFNTKEAYEKVINACNYAHNVPTSIPAPQDIKWLWTEEFKSVFPYEASSSTLPENIMERKVLVLCNHCANPSCVRVCPTKATYKLDNGIVTMDYHRCIGCRFCMAACPYGSRSYNFKDAEPHLKEINPEYPSRTRGAVEKCTFCVERLEKGLMPACVDASDGAILFGDLEDTNSSVRKALSQSFALRRSQTLGTDPSVYYIL